MMPSSFAKFLSLIGLGHAWPKNRALLAGSTGKAPSSQPSSGMASWLIQLLCRAMGAGLCGCGEAPPAAPSRAPGLFLLFRPVFSPSWGYGLGLLFLFGLSGFGRRRGWWCPPPAGLLPRGCCGGPRYHLLTSTSGKSHGSQFGGTGRPGVEGLRFGVRRLHGGGSPRVAHSCWLPR